MLLFEMNHLNSSWFNPRLFAVDESLSKAKSVPVKLATVGLIQISIVKVHTCWRSIPEVVLKLEGLSNQRPAHP